MILKAPFPWFGGKSRAAHLVWRGFGDVANYVEPFCGSMAVLLGRPSPPRIETVNDRDCFIANFWRAVQAEPKKVARWADWPVNEADLHARHRWLVNRPEWLKRMKHDPEFYDAKVAGWWVWGISQWIGSGWCALRPLANGEVPSEQAKKPRVAGVGVHGRRNRSLKGSSNWQKRPVLSDSNRGVHMVREQLPEISGDSGAAGKGVHSQGKPLGAVYDWMNALSTRLRRVRVCCGDWRRVLGRSSTEKIGVTGILLDPPYGTAADRDPSLYAHDDLDVAHKVREWAIANGDNPKLRIAPCGYEGEHDMPRGWEKVAWKAVGGYAASAGNTENAHRERIWFSPNCAVVEMQGELFAESRAAV